MLKTREYYTYHFLQGSSSQ